MDPILSEDSFKMQSYEIWVVEWDHSYWFGIGNWSLMLRAGRMKGPIQHL